MAKFLTLLLLALLLLSVAVFCYVGCEQAPEPDVQALKDQAGPLVEALTRYRQSNNAYPQSLASAGIEAPNTQFGQWSYYLHEDGGCEIAVGNYNEDNFVLFWNSSTGWHVDG